MKFNASLFQFQKLTFFKVVLICFTINSFSQEVIKREIYEKNKIGLNIGLSPFGWNISPNYEHKLNKKISVASELIYQNNYYKSFLFDDFGVYAGVGYEIVNLWNRLRIIPKAGFVVNNARLRRPSVAGDGVHKQFGIEFGGYMDLAIEARIYKSIYFNLKFKQCYLLSHFLGNQFYLFQTGLIYSF
ncbi:MAG: hypothetical protein SFY32_10720 [Bacteroidota bacterium]|nr:hypothetical protein [Bacteroidota bacterium]